MRHSGLMLTRGLVGAFFLAFMSCSFPQAESRAQGPRASSKRGVTMADVIGMTRFAAPIDSRSFSPDGKRFAFVLRKGNLEDNTNTYSLLVMETDQVFQGSAAKLLISFSSSSNREGIKRIAWLGDNDTIFFLGENPGELTQLYSIRNSTGELRKLTNHATNLTSYSASTSGDDIVYAAEKPVSDLMTSHVMHYGFHVSRSIDLPELIAGHLSDGESDRCELFVRKEGQGEDRRLNVTGRLLIPEPGLFLSPDGKYLVVKALVRDIDPAWREYNDPVLKMVMNWNLPQGSAIWIERYELVDTEDGRSRALIDAPIGYSNSEVAWSADSHSVIVTGVHLPLNVSDHKKREARRASTFVAEVTIRNLQIEEITDRNLELLGWEQDANLWKFQEEREQTKANNSTEFVYYRKTPTGWQMVGDISRAIDKPRPDIFVEQDLNLAPRLVAEDQKTNRKAVLFDPNPQLGALLLGIVEEIRWDDSAGHEIRGGLYLPPDYEPGKKYPLVIQTHGYHSHEFWMDGPYTTAFAARPLASEGIVVLQLPEVGVGSAEEGERNMRVMESAIDYLDQRGIIDRTRVGLIGFSRTCYHVKYALVHSKFHFVAASVTDGIDAGYFQYLSFGNWIASTAAEYETLEGAAPFGEGLKVWLEHAPGFLLDRVQTPLEIQAIGRPSSLLGEWEWFSGLTRLGKGVDFIYIPTGDHVLEKPWDRMVSQQRNVDWFLFWLKNEEDSDPGKREQYKHWRTLHEKKGEN
jgi:dipeptidyl aminopeptidase/acylaminoacyl peptidase